MEKIISDTEKETLPLNTTIWSKVGYCLGCGHLYQHQFSFFHCNLLQITLIDMINSDNVQLNVGSGYYILSMVYFNGFNNYPFLFRINTGTYIL